MSTARFKVYEVRFALLSCWFFNIVHMESGGIDAALCFKNLENTDSLQEMPDSSVCTQSPSGHPGETNILILLQAFVDNMKFVDSDVIV